MCIRDSSGNFDWEAHADKFPGLTQPDESYHGPVSYTHLDVYKRQGNMERPLEDITLSRLCHIPRMMIRSYTLCEEIMKK